MQDFARENCAVARRRISLRVDGELPAAEEALLDVHLATCAPCSARAAEVEALVARLRATPVARPTRNLQIPHQFAVARGVVGSIAAAAAVVLAVFSFHVPSRQLALQLPPAVVRSQLTLKEHQLTAIEAKGEAETRLRPSMPPGILAG